MSWVPRWFDGQKAEWERKEARKHADDVLIAEMALAGWRFVLSDVAPWRGQYHLISPIGEGMGHNDTIAGAARYAKLQMDDPSQDMWTGVRR